MIARRRRQQRRQYVIRRGIGPVEFGADRAEQVAVEFRRRAGRQEIRLCCCWAAPDEAGAAAASEPDSATAMSPQKRGCPPLKPSSSISRALAVPYLTRGLMLQPLERPIGRRPAAEPGRAARSVAEARAIRSPTPPPGAGREPSHGRDCASATVRAWREPSAKSSSSRSSRAIDRLSGR